MGIHGALNVLRPLGWRGLATYRIVPVAQVFAFKEYRDRCQKIDEWRSRQLFYATQSSFSRVLMADQELHAICSNHTVAKGAICRKKQIDHIQIQMMNPAVAGIEEF